MNKLNILFTFFLFLVTISKAQNCIPDFKDVQPDCAPYYVQFLNTSQNAKAYFWDFGDGFTSSLENPLHVFMADGVYKVSLIVLDSFDMMYSIYKDVTVLPTPISFFRVVPEIPLFGQEVYVFDQSAHHDRWGYPYSIWYKWDWGDDSKIDTEPEPSHLYLDYGNFMITLTVGTFTTPQCISTYVRPSPVTVTSSVPEIVDSPTFYIYPNPTDDIINIDFKSINLRFITISDITGNLLLKQSCYDQFLTLDFNSYPSGVYLLFIYDDDSKFTKKIIKH